MSKVSSSEIRLFRSCRRSWQYRFVRLLVPKHGSPHLWFGSAVHSALANYYTKQDWTPTSLLEGWNDYLAKHPMPGEAAHQALDVLGPNILSVYWHYENNVPRWKPKLVEQRFETPIPNTDHVFTAQLDLIIDGPDDTEIIVDHKTTRQLVPPAGVIVDGQMTSYMWAQWRRSGKIPKGAIYNTISKFSRGWPERLDNGSFSKKKNQRTTYDLFLFRLKKEGMDTGPYQEVLSYLKERPPVGRYFTTRSEHELLDFEHGLYHTVMDMEAVRQHPEEAYPNPSAYTCGNCPYLSLCKAKSEGKDEEFIAAMGYKQEVPHYDTDDIIEPE